MSFVSTLLVPYPPISIHVESYKVSTYDLYNQTGYDLGKDPDIQERIAKFYTKKLYDKWLKRDFVDILSYINVSGNKVDLIKDIKNYNKDDAYKDDEDVRLKKIEFLQNLFIDRNIMHKILSNMVKGTGIQWVKLMDNSHDVKKVVHHFLKRKIEESIAQKK